MLLFDVCGIIRFILYERKEYRSLRKPYYLEDGNQIDVLNERL